MEPFNLAAHEVLVAAGYSYSRVEADWYDAGDAENGPMLQGGPAYDLYEDANSHVVVGEDGNSGFEWRDLEMEAYVESMGQYQDANS